MKNKYTITYLCLLTGLFAAHQTLAQNDDGYKHLGWAKYEKEVMIPVQKKKVNAPAARQLLKNDADALTGVQRFNAQFPSRGTVILTNELLDLFDKTKQQTEGFHLFFGLEQGKFQPVIVHTKLNRGDTSLTDRDTTYYKADFRRAYFWNYASPKWNLVSASQTDSTDLKNRIIANRAKFPYYIKGYYFSKDALVEAWKSAGKTPLTLFFLNDGGEPAIMIPYYSEKTLAESRAILTQGFPNMTNAVPLLMNTLYTHDLSGQNSGENGFDVVQQARPPGQQTPAQTGGKADEFAPPTSTRYTRANRPTRVFKITGSVRCCPSYCGGSTID